MVVVIMDLNWRIVIMLCTHFLGKLRGIVVSTCPVQGDYDGRGQPTASPMLTAIMSGEVGICCRELYKYR